MKNDVSRATCRPGPTWMAASLALVAGILFHGPVAAQRSSELAIDLRPFGGSVSYAQALNPGLFLGLALGAGMDRLDRTIAPDPATEEFHAFEQLAYVSAFMRQKPSGRFDLDLGLRLGVGGVRECGASDCWPGSFVGLYGSAFWGSRRLKVGPRVMWAMARENGRSDAIFYAELLTVRIAF